MLAEELVVVLAIAKELATVYAALDRFWDGVNRSVAQPPDRDWRLRFQTAVVEVATNIVRHAYPTGTARGPMQLRLRCYADRLVASFSDRGIAVSVPWLRPGQIPTVGKGSSGADLLELPEGKYGLALARACLDRLDYRRTSDGTNHWRLLKRF